MTADVISTRPKPFIFVLMPFTDEFEDTYKLGIKPACQNAGAYCERVDEQIFVESILDRIYNQIAKADIIVEDMTDRNANVFYETGYAHALNKRVILLTQNADDIPFDLKHYPHIVYGGKIVSLKSQLETKVRWYIDNPDRIVQPEINLEFYINGISLVEEPEIEVKWNLGHSFAVDVYNPTPNIIKSYELAVIFPKKIHFDLPAMQSSNIHKDRMLLPEAWDSITFHWGLGRLGLEADEKFDEPMKIILRLYTDTGPRAFNFTIQP